MPPKPADAVVTASKQLKRASDLSLSVPFTALKGDPLTPKWPPDPATRQPRELPPGTLWAFVMPEAVPMQPRLVAVNREALESLGIDWSEAPDSGSLFAAAFTGQQLLQGSKPYAQRYGGVQFGHFAGQLGDGRVVTLGELEIDPDEGTRTEIQLKGIGVTPFSRRGDGYASLTGCVREWVFSEVLHALGIPVARTLAIYLTGKSVQRDHGPEPGAIISRAAPSYVRFGTFELLAAEKQFEALKSLLDFVAERNFRECLDDVSGWQTKTNKYGRILLKVAEHNAEMVAFWQAYYFSHGTINTDNLSLLGLTMDLSGPSAFSDAADPNWTPNLSDPGGLYSFDQQVEAVRNGLRSFCVCIKHLVLDRSGTDPVERTLAHFDLKFKKRYLELMRARLGLVLERPGDMELVDRLTKLLEDAHADVQIFFRELCKFRVYIPPILGSKLPEIPDYAGMLAKWHVERHDRRRKEPPNPEAIRARCKDWFANYTARVFRESEAWDSLIELERGRQARMRNANPKYLPKSWVLEEIVASTEAWAAGILSAKDDDVETLDGIMGRLEAITRHLRSGNLDKGGDREEGCRALERAMRVLVGDMFGQISEEHGNGSWKEGERELAKRWSGEPEDRKKINMLCTCSS